MRWPLLLGTFLSGCAGTYGHTLGVAELNAQHGALTARTVQVHGWLLPCHFRSCLLVESRDYGMWLEHVSALGRRMETRGDTSVQFPPRPKTLTAVSLGSSAPFDKEVVGLRDYLSEVIVEGRVTDECWPGPPKLDPVSGQQTITICADRAKQLEPIRLVKIIQQIPLPLEPEEY